MPPPAIPKPTDGNLSPKAWYQAASALPDFVHDAAQAAAIEELDQLWHQLVEFKSKRNQFLGAACSARRCPGVCICGAGSGAARHC